MANSKYAQVIDLLAQGKFNWVSDSVLGILVTGATFNAANKKLSELGATQIATTPINGRYLAEGGACMGLPAFFPTINGDTDYQLVLALALGGYAYDPDLLAFFDTDEEDESLHLDTTGTLVVRPTAVDPLLEGSVRMWMRL